MDSTGFNVYLSFRKYITRMLETQGEMVRFYRAYCSRQKKKNKRRRERRKKIRK